MPISTSSPTDHEHLHLSPQQAARIISRRQNSGSDARNLLAPPPCPYPNEAPVSSSPILHKKKKQPKNHMKVHRQALREKQLRNKQTLTDRLKKQDEERNKVKESKQRHYGNIQSKVFDGNSSAVSSAASSSSRSSADCCSSTTSSTRAIKQDDGINNVEDRRFLSSSSSHSHPPKIILQKNQKKQLIESSSSSDPAVASSTSSRHGSYGKIPAYLLERRATLVEEEEQRRRRQRSQETEGNDDAQEQNVLPAAESMVKLSDEERIETLRLLQDKEKKTLRELRRLPLAANTEGTIRKREALQQKVDEIRDAKAIFSKSKVYVQR